MSEMIVPPWKPEQVLALNRWQALGYVHEFTCPNDHDGTRVLVATEHGWRCSNCEYRQMWAHASMLGIPPRPVFECPECGGDLAGDGHRPNCARQPDDHA